MAASTRLGATMRDADNTAARRAALQAGARAQPEYDSSNFFASVFATSIDRRGVRAFAAPFAVVNAVSIAWTVIHERAATSAARADQGAFDGAYALTFSAMGFLLVFRLARAAVRWYDGRAAFGGIVAGVRAFVDVLLMYGGDDDRGRAAVDDGAAWACAFASASKCHLRGAREIERDEVAGILSDEDRVAVSRSKHPPLFCLSMCRRAVKRCFEGRGRDADAAALRYELNKRVDFLASQVGALERLLATKIPEIYVIHLRTFLFAYLISMPFVFVGRWGWGTIAAVACVSFALLGIEGAATECEIPFSATHANHLRMDQYVMGCFDNVAAMLEWQDERVNGERRGEVIRASVDVGVAIKADSPR